MGLLSKRVVVCALALCMGLSAASPAAPHWVATWGTAQQLFRGAAQPGPASPQAARPAISGPQRRFGIPPGLTGLKNQTVRMIVRASIGGQSVRIRLSNAFGGASLTVGAAHVALRGAESAIRPGTDRVLTFSGRPSAILYAGQALVSDSVSLNVAPLSDLAVSLYLPGDTGPPTSHTFGLRTTYISGEGDFSGAAQIAAAAATTQSYYWLAGVDVLAPATAGALVTFGDSITDGDQSTPDTSAAWPAILAARLQANAPTAQVAVVNAGIAGNRILGDNGGGLARLLPHALSVPGVKWISLLEGINDITAATRSSQGAVTMTAEDLIAAYRQVIETAHLYGVKVIGCTLTPYGGSSAYTEAGEAIRQAANQWIRTSGAFDAVVDFDAATRDAKEPQRFRLEADSPDMLHPGDAGYKLMGEAFDLKIFGG